MKYTNGFTINCNGAECFLTFLQNKPNGQTKTTEEAETMVMNEQCARQLANALLKVYEKIDSDRAAKKAETATEFHGTLS